jgi:hypothetical protein
MKGNSMHLRLLCILAVFCPIRVGEAMTLDRVESDLPDQVGAVDTLIQKAEQANDVAAWASYLMQADAAAEKLESTKPSGCCGLRCVRVRGFELHFRYNGIQDQENYQHDLLQLITIHGGTPYGAEALVRLLPTGCQTIASQWTPYFKTVIGILESRPWRAMSDPRLTKIRAEAYETWWSLSQSSPDDPDLEDQRLTPQDFVEGAAQARQQAIDAYQEIVNSKNGSPEILEHLAKLKSGEDTRQRSWFCLGD